MVVMSNEKPYSKEQIDQLSSQHFINRIDDHLRTVSSIKIVDTADNTTRVILFLEIFYDNHKIDTMSFDLHDHNYEDIVDVARNISTNEFILQEIDNFLSGYGE